MTDKVQKIREEVERLKRWNNNVRNSTRHMTLQEEDFNRGKHSSYLEILNFIDSLQEEQQMMAKAVDGVITFDYYGDDDKTYGCIAHDSFCLEDFGLKDTDKVKMILIKED